MIIHVDPNHDLHPRKAGAQEIKLSIHHGSYVLGDILISLDHAIRIADFVAENVKQTIHSASAWELK